MSAPHNFEKNTLLEIFFKSIKGFACPLFLYCNTSFKIRAGLCCFICAWTLSNWKWMDVRFLKSGYLCLNAIKSDWVFGFLLIFMVFSFCQFFVWILAKRKHCEKHQFPKIWKEEALKSYGIIGSVKLMKLRFWTLLPRYDSVLTFIAVKFFQIEHGQWQQMVLTSYACAYIRSDKGMHWVLTSYGCPHPVLAFPCPAMLKQLEFLFYSLRFKPDLN